jgi:hypothetical protein
MTGPTPTIRIRSVPALAGLRWIRLALRAFGRQPGGFMGMFGLYMLCLLLLTIPLSLLVPLAETIHLDPAVVGTLTLVAMPLLSLAFMLSTEAVTNDVRISPALLFAPLRASAQARRSLLAIGFAYFGVFLLAWIAGNGLDGGESVKWFLANALAQPDAAKAPATPTPLSDAGRGVLLLKMAIVALGSIPLWHAPALVQWGRYGAAKAMFASIVAMWRTRAALAVFGLGWFALSMAVTAALAVLALVLGESIILLLVAAMLYWALSALFYVTLWFGFNDTFEFATAAPFRTVTASDDPPAS